MADKTVPLSKRYEVPGHEPFDKLVLRAPVYQDIFIDGLGEPAERQPNGAGGFMVVVYHSVVDKYVQRLLRSPDYSCITQLEACDALDLQNEIIGFFSKRVASTTSPASPTPLSSGSDGTPPASS
ncbi:hypothetical protein LAC81_15050 [Ensifer adhaerens]|uniref:hypothetical protein n=1 Tax=Ensifer adhaerens TaxID=106592 RepID=UPI001CBC0C2A|nr:hypothetical protein [Ensifer adhaerens]MBZ7923107.1 hypothetical protein [Ensifer adhaerens]UAX91697.1 hypothetical protein LAC78_15045 [Ensifer adhaerens]UAX99325.1 hypothetical protein LAC80_15050 [Ensifer adhaerens]UAY06708.1 hypothetical protein LAC81_15050 [Ensifer adhaerens]